MRPYHFTKMHPKRPRDSRPDGKPLLAFALAAAFALASCRMSFRNEKESEDGTDGAVSFTNLRSRVIGPRCVRCHGFDGGVTLETYAQVIANLEAIKRTALSDNPTMPKDSPLTPTEAAMLRAWIDAGAPDAPIDPPPPAEEVRPEFASLHRLVISRKCTWCHGPGGSASWLPLLTYEEVAGDAAALVVPFDPDSSFLYQVVAGLSLPAMPPADSGTPALTPQELAALREWIARGALNNGARAAGANFGGKK